MIDMRRHARFRHRVEQFAHAGRAVLRLLHRKADQVVVLRVRPPSARRPRPCRAACAVSSSDRVLAALHRQPHAEAFGVDQVRLGRQADMVHVVPAEQHLGAEQRAVGRAQDEDVVRHAKLRLFAMMLRAGAAVPPRMRNAIGASVPRAIGSARLHDEPIGRDGEKLHELRRQRDVAEQRDRFGEAAAA